MSPLDLVSTPRDMREWSREAASDGRRIGFVPTMGALHEGHVSLCDALHDLVDVIVMSIFVNPLQFSPHEDFDRYPRTPETDARLAKERGVACIFTPSVDDMYGRSGGITIDPGPLGSVLEGAARPGHFAGVLTVVQKLLHIVEPDVAVFGRKDYQQALLIRRMVADLDMDVDVRVAPTVREPDGLAMSSRNAYLDSAARTAARALSAALDRMHVRWREGAGEATSLLAEGRAILTAQSGVEPDYIALADPDTLDAVQEVSADTVALVAARVGSTRLIDNVIVGAGIGADPTAAF